MIPLKWGGRLVTFRFKQLDWVDIRANQRCCCHLGERERRLLSSTYMPPAPLWEQERAGKKTNLKLMYRFPWKKLWLVIEKKPLGSRASSDVLIQRRYCLNKKSHIEKYSFIGFNVSFYVCGFYVLSSVTMWRTKFFESWICRQCCICGVLVTGM